MKKFCSILVLFGVLFAVQAGFTGEDLREFKEFKEKAVKECKASTQATDEDVLALKMHEAPTTRSAKCLSACVLEKLGSIVDGAVVVETVKAVGEKKYAGNDELIKAFKEIADECASVSGSDHCELSANLIECTNKAAKARGVEFPKA